jgi:HEPN superfamily AbiU2-like protein
MTIPETREQRLAAKREKMPRDLADLHWHLEDELTWLHLAWKEYKTLYATNQKRVDLLNETAPNFFAHFQDLVWRETMLHLCRLTDPPKSVGKDTLTVRRLPSAIDDAKLSARVQQEADAAAQATSFARDWRHRRIAHRSLEHVLNPQLKPLARASREDIENALAALRQVMNSVSVHYEGYHHDFEGIIPAFTGAKALIYYLSSGLEADEARKRVGEQWSPPHW